MTNISRRALLNYFRMGIAGIAMAEAGLIRPAFAAQQFNWASTGGSWGEQIQKAFIDTPNFAEKTNLKLAHTAQLETVSASKIVTNCGSAPYDASNHGPAEVVMMRDAGCLTEYDLDLVPNFKDIPAETNIGNYYGIFALMLMGMVWNTKEAKKPASFEDLWRPEYKGRVGIPAFGWYGMYWLHALNKVLGGNEDNIEPAMTAVADLAKKNNVIIVENAAHGMKLFESGEVVIAPYWNGRATRLQDQGVPVGFEAVEGTLAAGQGFVITKGTEHKKEACELVNNTFDPELQLMFARYSKYPPSNKKAVLPPDLERIKVPQSAVEKVAVLDYTKISETRAPNLEQWNKRVLAN